jgi:hypothetical protein
MGFGYVVGATPTLESASLQLKLFEFSGGRRNQGNPKFKKKNGTALGKFWNCSLSCDSLQM